MAIQTPNTSVKKHRNVLTEKLYKIYIQPQRVVVAVVQWSQNASPARGLLWGMR